MNRFFFYVGMITAVIGITLAAVMSDPHHVSIAVTGLVLAAISLQTRVLERL